MTENNERTTKPFDENFCAGIRLMWRTYMYAEDANANQWDFALEIDKLYETGLTISDLHWLVTSDYVHHGQESSTYGDIHRFFRPCEGLDFTDSTCFVLTPKGAEFAAKFLKEATSAK